MSPAQQQPQEEAISREALVASVNQYATQLLNTQLSMNELTVKLGKALELLKQCAEEHGPKAEDGANATDADMTTLDTLDNTVVPTSLDGPRPMLRRKGG